MTSRKSVLALLAGAATWLAAPAWAQAPAAFPTKTVRVITAFPVGSGPDVLLRSITPKLQRKWGQGVIVDNRPGGNGFIAIDAFKRGAADGHDLLLVDAMNLTGYPHLFKKLPYDPAKDFEPLMPVFRAPFFVVVGSQSPFRTVGDILGAAKASPGKLNYGSWSIGNPVHLGTAQLQSATGTKMTHVVYKDAVMLYAATTTQEVDFALGTLATVKTFTGRLKPLAVASAQRHPALPDLPTVAESGGPAGFDVSGWALLAAPRGVPSAAAQVIRADFDAALAEADVQELFRGFGYDRLVVPVGELPARLAAESGRMGEVIKAANISLD